MKKKIETGGWRKTESSELPGVGEVVVGLFKNQAMKCYIDAYGTWVDMFHGWPCYRPPLYWCELPKEQQEEVI